MSRADATSAFSIDEAFQSCLAAYARLAADTARGLPFVSDWNGQHNAFDPVFSELLATPLGELGDFRLYSHMSTDPELLAMISRRHVPEPQRDRFTIVVGGGASATLATALLYFTHQSLPAVLTTPLHYTIPTILSINRIPMTAANDTILLDEHCTLNLPPVRSAVIISDPVWICGRTVPERIYRQLGDWQCATGSWILIDATFHGLEWGGERRGFIDLPLDHARTIICVCPTKAVAMHGTRFAYLIAPNHCAQQLSSINDAMHGNSGLLDLIMAKAIMRLLDQPEGNGALCTMLKARYEQLTAMYPLLHERAIIPHSGYFVFARLPELAGRVAGMNGAHFMLPQHSDHYRLNLLSPDLDHILAEVS